MTAEAVLADAPGRRRSVADPAPVRPHDLAREAAGRSRPGRRSSRHRGRCRASGDASRPRPGISTEPRCAPRPVPRGLVGLYYAALPKRFVIGTDIRSGHRRGGRRDGRPAGDAPVPPALPVRRRPHRLRGGEACVPLSATLTWDGASGPRITRRPPIEPRPVGGQHRGGGAAVRRDRAAPWSRTIADRATTSSP